MLPGYGKIECCDKRVGTAIHSACDKGIPEIIVRYVLCPPTRRKIIAQGTKEADIETSDEVASNDLLSIGWQNEVKVLLQSPFTRRRPTKALEVIQRAGDEIRHNHPGTFNASAIFR